MTSTQGDLTSRFQRRLENERAEIEATAARELKVLGESLRGVAESALSTIEADTAAWIGKVRGMFLRAWMWLLAFGLMLSAGICRWSWAGTRWLWTTIEQQIETLTVLRVDIEQARQTLAQSGGDDLERGAARNRRRAVRRTAGWLTGPSAVDRGRGSLP